MTLRYQQVEYRFTPRHVPKEGGEGNEAKEGVNEGGQRKQAKGREAKKEAKEAGEGRERKEAGEGRTAKEVVKVKRRRKGDERRDGTPPSNGLKIRLFKALRNPHKRRSKVAPGRDDRAVGTLLTQNNIYLLVSPLACRGRDVLRSTWLLHKNAPIGPFKDHNLTEYGREIATSSTTVFLLIVGYYDSFEQADGRVADGTDAKQSGCSRHNLHRFSLGISGPGTASSELVLYAGVTHNGSTFIYPPSVDSLTMHPSIVSERSNWMQGRMYRRVCLSPQRAVKKNTCFIVSGLVYKYTCRFLAWGICFSLSAGVCRE
ncbi:hypothetical protein EVAR_103894_1 [Eumeta japonica]|uniref:Uncharacterized protein n=1 Tax=Eumeta variegata TaxID=151549 RepID=A0A4C1ZP34_EUMVA|nr:hypothetical protein EVAR_103894_1 [Eumeta japonica]